MHGFKGLVSQVLIAGKKVNISYEDMKYIEAISDYDPYNKPPKPPTLKNRASYGSKSGTNLR